MALMVFDLFFDFVLWVLGAPRRAFRCLTGQPTPADWVQFGWRHHSHTVSARELADIEGQASQRSAQSRIDDILFEKNRPMRGGKEDPWGNTKR